MKKRYPRIYEAYFVSRFIHLLKDGIQAYVLLFHPITVIDACDFACIYEYSICSCCLFENSSATIIQPQSLGETILCTPEDTSSAVSLVLSEEVVEKGTSLHQIDVSELLALYV